MPFKSLNLNPQLHDSIARLGFTRPTPIQEQAIPAILTGRDVIGNAETGSGKTAAYLLPIFTILLAERRPRTTRVLVLVPTRELALQVDTVARDIGHAIGIQSAAVFGGVGMGPQVKALRDGVDCIVATPGRLLDHVQRRNARLDLIEILVIDEADRMLDIGFLPDIRRIVSLLRANRQSLLFSATMPDPIVRLAHSIMNDPVVVRIGELKKKHVIPIGITHAVYPIQRYLKIDFLLALLKRTEMPSALIFTRTRDNADRVHRRLRDAGYRTDVMHSNRSQGQRVEALEGLRSGRIQLLVATDLAARGLDVDNISHVINFDLPQTPEDYVNRVGRTGRAEATGDAFSLVAIEETIVLGQIEREIGQSLPRVTLPDFPYAGGRPPAIMATPILPPPVFGARRRRRMR